MEKSPHLIQILDYQINFNKELGRGTFCIGYEAINIKTNQKLAVKVIPNEKFILDDQLDNLFLIEIKIQSEIQSNHGIHFVDVKISPESLYVFIDFCDEADLKKKTQKRT